MRNTDFERLYEDTAEELHSLKTRFKCDLIGLKQYMFTRFCILESDIKLLPEGSETKLRMEGELEATVFWLIKLGDLCGNFFPDRYPTTETETSKYFDEYRKTMKEWPNNGLEFSFPEKHKPTE